jgi:antitoxin component YwqK of YwqJK toxin-antitoxin module
MLTVLFKIATLSTFFQLQAAPTTYTCGEKKTVARPYGNVEIRVDCELMEGKVWIAEFKGKTLHGISQTIDRTTGRKVDSCFYRNGNEHGSSLVWDSVGNVVGRSNFRNGKQIGKQEIYFSVGRPAIIKHFNDKGEEEGSWEEWWPNGNKKAEFMAKGGRIVSGTEFYQNGKPRLRYASKYEPKVRSVFKKKRIQAEAWAPDGRPAGKIVNGEGEWLLFPDGRDTTDKTVFREVYKDSLMIKGEELDSAEAARWFK